MLNHVLGLATQKSTILETAMGQVLPDAVRFAIAPKCSDVACFADIGSTRQYAGPHARSPVVPQPHFASEAEVIFTAADFRLAVV